MTGSRGAESATEYRRHLGVIGAEVARMRRTITGLLTLARADAGVLQAAFRCVDVVDLLQVVVARWQPLFERRNATLESSLPEDGAIFCDPDLLVRVVDNLLDNALRAVSSAGVVELIVRRDADDWLFTVRDSGPGIDPDIAATFMDLRAQPSMPRSRGNAGTGFGLALCAAIVKAHQGSIHAERSTDGAVFTVRLPAAARPSHAG